jgi:hypothetical protein
VMPICPDPCAAAAVLIDTEPLAPPSADDGAAEAILTLPDCLPLPDCSDTVPPDPVPEPAERTAAPPFELAPVLLPAAIFTIPPASALSPTAISMLPPAPDDEEPVVKERAPAS